ncbi:hypothetical protein CYLTODRAFT_495439, partial [Cylindrobasidium torrendii FP15055 ss-10]
MRAHGRGKPRNTFRVFRDDDNLVDGDVVSARSLALSQDRRRVKTVFAGTCAQVGDSGRTDWQSTFDADLADELHKVTSTPHRYINSDHNIATWVSDGMGQEYLEEFMRLRGRRGCSTVCPRCPASTPNTAEYRCDSCFGAGLLCEACFLSAHTHLPFHRFEKWNGEGFDRVTARSLGINVVVGHDDGTRCAEGKVVSKFTILDTGGCHVFDVVFCRCERRRPKRIQLLRAQLFPSTARQPRTALTFALLREHEDLAAHGKLSPYEHYNALQHMTDAWGIDLPKPRLKPFTRANRKFCHLNMLARAGRGCVKDGRKLTAPGELAIPCIACPREGINIPENWREDPKRYMLMLMMDANFRLNNLRRASTPDVGLHTGLAYLVADEPYKMHYSKYKKQTDISNCSGFKTLEMAETKDATGLRSTGLGMVACARHEIIRPLGVGDLQKGERYCNMDYVAMSAAQGVNLERFYSYDVACQWCIHLMDRIQDLPPDMRPPEGVKLSFGVPKCHAKGHLLLCQCCFSMHVQVGVGEIDCEGIERCWAGINHSAPSTKEMLPGHRHDILDRRMGTHNWEKVIRMGKHLHGSLEKELQRYQDQLEAHAAFVRQIPAGNTVKWDKQVTDWEEGRSGDRRTTTPYWRERTYTKERDLVIKLNEEDRRANKIAIHDMNVVAFLQLGLKIEQSQRDIRALLVCSEKDSLHIVEDIQTKRLTMTKDLQQFRSVQQSYMPFMAGLLVTRAGEREGDIETEKLYMPSNIPAALRGRCLDGAVEKEALMRESQCYTALEEIRSVQRAVHQVNGWTKANVRGTKKSGRSFDIIKRLRAKGQASAVRYRAARQSLHNLRGGGSWEHVLQELQDSDIKDVASEVFSTD